MDQIRKPFQGVLNIIRFNWHFYVLGMVFLFLLILAGNHFSKPAQTFIFLISALAAVSICISLFVSFYVYDLSGLYKLQWIDQTNTETLIVNINAGFDETSVLLKHKFNYVELIVLDFYDPANHTEISIKRARKAYPPFENTRQITTTQLPLAADSADKIFVILAAHEIRDEAERALFFSELRRVIKPGGQIYVTEHLRDIPNFLAYNIGFFHFYSRHAWAKTFTGAALKINRERKITPFISTFILYKDGNTL